MIVAGMIREYGRDAGLHARRMAGIVWLWMCCVLVMPGALWAGSGQGAEIIAGPMPGHSAMRAVRLWLMTDREASVQVKYWPESRPEASAMSQIHRSRPGYAHTVEIDLVGLEPGTRYAYTVWLDGEEQPVRYRQQFRTQPLWQWRGDPPDFSFALGSCSHINQPAYDRPNEPYGGDYQIFDAIADKRPDFMLWLGDNWYYREADWDSVWGLYQRASYSRRAPELQRLLVETHHYAIWDDHDFGPNDSDASYRLRDHSIRLFQEFWPNPDFSVAGLDGVTNHFEWHDAAFFLLDNRSSRSANDRVSGHRMVLGQPQIDWLINALKSSHATFKFIVIGGQFLNSSEDFENYNHLAPGERRRVLDAITAEDIPGVIFLSGDRHHSVLLRMDHGVDYPIHDWTVSPLTSRAHPPRPWEGQYRVEGSLFSQRAFGTVSITGPRSARIAELKLFDSDGRPLWNYRIDSRDLQP